MKAQGDLDRFARLACRDEDRIRLDEAALEICRIGRPDLDPAPSLAALDELALRTQARRGTAEGPLGVVGLLNRSLFEEEAFRGNGKNYHDPRNSFLDQVMERRLGIPITLAVVYMEVARRLDVKVEGVGFPGHFLLRAHTAEHEWLLDPFREGMILTYDDCQLLMDRSFGAAIQLDPRFLEPVGPRYILSRILRNLKRIYVSRKDLKLASEVMDRLVLLDPENLVERRDRGKIRYSLGDHLGAAVDLENYLIQLPNSEDRDEVRGLIHTIRTKQAMAN